MMQSEIAQPLWLFNNTMDFTVDMDTYMEGCDFSSQLSCNPSLFLIDQFVNENDIGVSMEDFTLLSEESQPMLGGEIEDICRLLSSEIEDSEWSSCPSLKSSDASKQMSFEEGCEWSPYTSMKSVDASADESSIQQLLSLSGENMEIDYQVGVINLLKAYGEATEKEQTDLAEVIVKRLCEKVNPIGETMERLAFNLFQSMEKEGEYLTNESNKSFVTALKAFYQIFPYGKFAHFTANSTILEAIPEDVDTIHIIDFDMGEGLQWPYMIEAIGRLGKALKLTSIKCREDYNMSPPKWRFEETKQRLCDHARSMGVKLNVEEMYVEELMSEIKKMKKRGGRKEWLAFNCIVGVPHMGRPRSRRYVVEFIQLAKDVLADNKNRGVIILGDGDDGEKLRASNGFGSFFDGCLEHYQALYESIEWEFPVHLSEARIAMESLFLSPYVSSLAWSQKWEELQEGCDLCAGMGLESSKFSKQNLMEAKEMVNEGQSSYEVTIEGKNENEMVLKWRGTPLVRVYSWR